MYRGERVPPPRRGGVLVAACRVFCCLEKKPFRASTPPRPCACDPYEHSSPPPHFPPPPLPLHCRAAPPKAASTHARWWLPPSWLRLATAARAGASRSLPPPASVAPSITGSPPTRAARGAGTRPHGRQRAAPLPLPSSGYPLSMKSSGERRRRVRGRRESAAVAAAAGQAGDPPPPDNTGGAASRRRRRPRAWPCRADQRGGTAARSGRGSNRTGGPAVQRPTRPAVSPAPLHGRPPSSAGSQTHR